MTTSGLTSVAVAVTALALACSGAPSAAPATPPQSVTQARMAPGNTLARPRKHTDESGYTYGWPVKPFHRQHPVRGFFGDPRISNHHRNHQFHFGVDVSAPDGTPVYATISGRAYIHPLHPTTIAVVADSGVEFSYWHVVPSIREGARAIAYRTVIGHIEAPYAHVHFSERRNGIYLNPLRPGAMGPFVDTTRPKVVRLTSEIDGRRVTPVAGQAFDVIVESRDETPLAVPRPWHDLPVMPAIVRWRLLTKRGTVLIGWRTVVDFRETIPPASDWDRIWASGTTQNHVRQPGRYRLYLSHSDGQLSALPRGTYVVEVALGDTRGNGGRTRLPLQLRAA
jgi:hypothetical protein